MKGKRQQWKKGAIVTIPLGNGYHSYAQMLEFPENAFFDARTRVKLTSEAVLERRVLFRLWVMQHAHSQGRWLKVGSGPVSNELQEPVLRYIQDSLNPQDIRLTYDGTPGSTCDSADCETLECAAVWDPEHVEDRLRDHYAGVSCVWVESLKLKERPIELARRKVSSSSARRKRV